MYDKDVEILQIMQNARKFGVGMFENIDILKTLLFPKEIHFNEMDFESLSEIFSTLEKIKEDSQLSKS